MNRYTPFTQRYQGFSLLEILIAVVLFSLVLVSLMSLENNIQDNMKDQVVLSQFVEIEQAAKNYIQSDFANIYASSATPSVIPFSTLQGASMVKMGVQSTNAYGQTHCVLVTRSGTNLLALVVTEGGTAIANNNLGALIRQSKSLGAFSGATLEGNGGSWVLPNAMTTFGNRNCSGTTMNQGHIASLLFFNSLGQFKDFMYRNPTAGMPDRNRMYTNLDMGNKDINNVNALTSKSIVNAGAMTSLITDVTNEVNNTNTVNATTYNNAATTQISGTLKADNMTSLSNVVAGINTVVFGSETGADPTFIYLNDDAYLGQRGGGTTRLSQLLPTLSSRGAYAVTNGTTIMKPTDCPNSSPTKPYAVLELTVAGASMRSTLRSGVIYDVSGNPYLWDGGTEYIRYNGYYSDTGASFQTFFVESSGPGPTGPWTAHSNNGKGIAHVYCQF